MTFTEAISILGIDLSAGPEGAHDAYQAMLRSSDTPTPEDRTRLAAAYQLLRSSEAWERNSAYAPVRRRVAASTGTHGTSRRVPVETSQTASDPDVPNARPQSPGKRGATTPTGPREAQAAPSRPVHLAASGLRAKTRTPSLASQRMGRVKVGPFGPSQLIDRLAGVLDPDDVMRAFQNNPADGPSNIIQLLLAQRRLDTAGTLVESVLEEMTRNGYTRPIVAPRHILRVILRECEAGNVAAAERMMRLFRTWKRDAILSRFDPRVEERFKLVAELMTISTDLPRPVREAVVSALLTGDNHGSAAALKTYAQSFPAQAERSQALMRTATPALAAILAENLTASQPATTRRKKARAAPRIQVPNLMPSPRLVVFALLVLAIGLSAHQLTLRTVEPNYALYDIENKVCELTQDGGMCDLVSDVVTALEAEDCESTKIYLTRIKRHTDRMSRLGIEQPDVDTQVSQLEREAIEACGKRVVSRRGSLLR